MRKNLKSIAICGIIAAVSIIANAPYVSAQNTDRYAAYSREIYVSQKGDTLNYRLLRPAVAEPGEKYPLVVFMHGRGECGTDNEKQLIHGGQMWLNPVNRAEYPAYVLAPQCPDSGYWAYAERPESFEPEQMPANASVTPIIEDVMALVQKMVDNEAVDSSRIYVMGLSMGGMATYDMAVRYPQVFAAAVPICGTVNPSRLAVAAPYVAFRIYHGDADTTVTVEGSRAAYRALKDAGARVQYFELPGVTHNSWGPAFNDRDFLPWLFSCHK